MNVLWITNIKFPAICYKLGIPSHPGGGWMVSLAREIARDRDVNLAVATVYNGDDYKEFNIENIKYYLLVNNSNKYILGEQFSRIVEKFNPDIIHIHGTEYSYGLSCMRSCPNENYVISLQGLVSELGKYFFAGIKVYELLKSITINDIRRQNTIFQQKWRFQRRSKYEIEYIRNCNNIIGRTYWDYAHIKVINKSVEYHLCNEMLRNCFYDSPGWNIECKNDYSIFVSQAGYALKGLHQVIKALTYIREYYPNVQLRIAGPDITKYGTWREKININGYGFFLRYLIKTNKLDKQVTFTGILSGDRMAEEYRNAHVFLCPSSIENSPNSLGEAQMIGTPCVASFVGGIPDMIQDGETGLLYRFDDYIMLAFQVIKIFQSDNLAKILSTKSRIIAAERHNREMIKSRTLNIYSKIIT